MSEYRVCCTGCVPFLPRHRELDTKETFVCFLPFDRLGGLNQPFGQSQMTHKTDIFHYIILISVKEQRLRGSPSRWLKNTPLIIRLNVSTLAYFTYFTQASVYKAIKQLRISAVVFWSSEVFIPFPQQKSNFFWRHVFCPAFGYARSWPLRCRRISVWSSGEVRKNH